ncbi:MAG: matrixin family metalloprotease [Vicinamibacterales bacterium]|nr:matrixin family metalloprotease [Vicinamibacterales bacterium]
MTADVRRVARALVIALVVTAGVWGTAQAYLKYGVLVNNQQITLRWSTMPIRYFLNDQVPSGVTFPGFQAAVQRAFASWAAVPTARVSFQHVGNIGSRPLEQDGVSVLGFLDRPEMDRVLGATSYVVDVTSGEIVEVDIFFNAAFPWSTASGGEPNRYDVESIALHEIGHLLGLGHSALGETELRPGGGRRVIAAEAVMFPIAFSPGSVEGRRLRADDIAGISDVYDGPGFLQETGSISGRVTKNGQPVFGAHVVAFNPATGKLVGNFTLGTNGGFAIAGLGPGPHVVRVEPLDDADLTSFFQAERTVDVSFQVTYLDRLAVVPKGGNAGPFEIKVTAR